MTSLFKICFGIQDLANLEECLAQIRHRIHSHDHHIDLMVNRSLLRYSKLLNSLLVIRNDFEVETTTSFILWDGIKMQPKLIVNNSLVIYDPFDNIVETIGTMAERILTAPNLETYNKLLMMNIIKIVTKYDLLDNITSGKMDIAYMDKSTP